MKEKGHVIEMTGLEKLTREYADCFNRIRGIVDEMETEIRAIKKSKTPRLMTHLETLEERRNALKAAIEKNAQIFDKPKTRAFHGIKIGFRKGPGELNIEDPEKTIALIKKNYPEKAKVLIQTTEKLLKKPLGLMPAADLKKLGVEVNDTCDEVYIAPLDGDIEKIAQGVINEMKAAKAV